MVPTAVLPMTWLPGILRSRRNRLDAASRRVNEPIVIGRQVAVLRIVAAVSWLVPLLLLGVIAWQTWKLEIEEVDSRVTSTLTILVEETQKVFENQEMA